VLGDGRTVERDALFIRPVMRPCLGGLLTHLGCQTDDLGFLLVDTVGRTNVSGVWAAGNAANPRAQVITAAGEGSAAAISINADLVQEDVDRAVDVRPAPGRLSLQGAIPYPGPDWSPPRDRDVVLIDDDGSLAIDGSRHMQAAGWPRVKALFGGLDLYEFSLDPEVVGAETFLVRAS